MKRILRAIFLLLVLAAWGQAGWQHSHLPERIASHFNGMGQPNGWLSRDALLGWQIGTMAFLAALFCGIAYLQPRLPTEFVNLPHRNYWLAPERRAATDAWIAGLVFAAGSLVVAFLMFVFHLVYRANLTPEPRLPASLSTVTLLIVPLLVGLIVIIFLRFARKPPA